MVSLIRIDDRLLHGQIAFAWTEYLHIDRIIVANDSVVKNDIKKMSLMMAAPDDVKCYITSINDAIEILNDGRSSELKILVIVNNPKDAGKIAENRKEISTINISTYGRKQNGDSVKKEVIKNVYVSEEDILEFKGILKAGIKIEYQVVPSNEAKDFGLILENI